MGEVEVGEGGMVGGLEGGESLRGGSLGLVCDERSFRASEEASWACAVMRACAFWARVYFMLGEGEG